MKAEVSKAGVRGNSEYQYDAFKSVCETQQAFYFYIADRQALIVPKANIFEGTAEELSKQLSGQIGRKLIQY